MNIFKFLVNSFLILTFYAVSVFAGDIYSWVDANGIKHFSDTMPDGVDFKTNKAIPAAPGSDMIRPGYNKMVAEAKEMILQDEFEKLRLAELKMIAEEKAAEADRFERLIEAVNGPPEVIAVGFATGIIPIKHSRYGDEHRHRKNHNNIGAMRHISQRKTTHNKRQVGHR